MGLQNKVVLETWAVELVNINDLNHRQNNSYSSIYIFLSTPVDSFDSLDENRLAWVDLSAVWLSTEVDDLLFCSSCEFLLDTSFLLLGSVLSGELVKSTLESRLVFTSLGLFFLDSFEELFPIFLPCMASCRVSLSMPELITLEELLDKEVSSRMEELSPTFVPR